MKCPSTRVSYGVPQGSALGLASYMLPLGNIICNHDLHCCYYVMSYHVRLTIHSDSSLFLEALETGLSGEDLGDTSEKDSSYNSQ